MHSRCQMTNQSFEACKVGAKKVTVKGRSLVWKKLVKTLDRMRHKTPEDLGKGLDRGRTQCKPTKN